VFAVPADKGARDVQVLRRISSNRRARAWFSPMPEPKRQRVAEKLADGSVASPR